jgi:hypothetical protein
MDELQELEENWGGDGYKTANIIQEWRTARLGWIDERFGCRFSVEGWVDTVLFPAAREFAIQLL